MLLEKGSYVCPDGRVLTLRSPRAEDAATMLDYLRQTSAETHFMAREADEFNMSVEDEAAFLTNYLNMERGFMLAAFDGNEVVANCDIAPYSSIKRVRHRASFGIAIKQKFCGQGLGTELMRIALDEARRLGYLQVELGVYADNPRARHVYEKLGFREMGVFPNAFRLSDGSFRDEVQMVLFL